MPTSRDPDAWLPLTPALFYVLVALADEDKHGYAIIKDVEALTDGQRAPEQRHALRHRQASARRWASGRVAAAADATSGGGPAGSRHSAVRWRWPRRRGSSARRRSRAPRGGSGAGSRRAR